MSPPPLTLRDARLDEILPLRHAVLRPGRPFDTAHFEGDDEPDTRHLAAVLVDGGDVVGCLSLLRRPWQDEPAWQLRGMATRADLARRGIGAALLRHAEDSIRPSLVWCYARLVAVPFYQHGGWTIVSPLFDIPGIGPHHAMTNQPPRRQAVTPPTPS